MAQQQQRFYTPREVGEHNHAGDCWVSLFDRVYDLTSLVSEDPQKSAPILARAGQDVTDWFNPRTGDFRTFVHPQSNLTTSYSPEGIVPHVPPPEPRSDFRNDFGTPWWRDEARCRGRLTAHPRRITVVNALTKQRDVVEGCEEETLREWRTRYSSCNSHAGSYTWKYDGRVLDESKTLADNQIPDTEESFTEVGSDGGAFLPSLLLYFNDDLTDG